MPYIFALVGNPNSGKTTMFNEFTGSSQYVGNWPGVTVEKKEGKVKKIGEDIRIIDLPGIYSLSPYSIEEVVSREYLLEEGPDVVINIVEATNIERNLYLTTQLIELGVPVVVALNMMDALEAKGDKIDIEKLQTRLGVPVIPTSANKGKGMDVLLQKALEKARENRQNPKGIRFSHSFFDDRIERGVSEVETLLLRNGKEGRNGRWTALKLLEGDERIQEKMMIPKVLMSEIHNIRGRIETEYENDMETVIADNRYRYITEVVNGAVQKRSGNHLSVSDRIDQVVTNRVLAIPLFLGVMYGIFQITFGTVGSATIDFLDDFINGTLAGLFTGWLEAAHAASWLIALVVDGILAGVGSIMVFVPQIMILFFFLSILEDSGYMARAAFVMDRLLRKLGLSGKSFIPMLLGFGCSVPAVMASRTLENEKDRRLTIILTPFMSCGARLPIYSVFAAAFFAKNQTTVIFSIYLLGILIAILSGILLKKTVLKGEAAPFVMELPPYRIPTAKGLFIHMWDRGKGFMKKAGTVIFAASVIIWFCQTFSFGLKMVEDPQTSIFGVIGSFIAPIFAPLGFGDWRSSVALLTGLVAKEVVVATMGILHGIGESDSQAALITALQGVFTPLRAYAFMAFTLLYMPCIAAFGAIKREMNSWKWTLFAVVYQTGVAWIIAFLIYQVGTLMGIR